MSSSARDLTQAASGVMHPQLPLAQCDACEGPMLVPRECVEAGKIIGLLICTQCIEDELEARMS